MSSIVVFVESQDEKIKYQKIISLQNVKNIQIGESSLLIEAKNKIYFLIDQIDMECKILLNSIENQLNLKKLKNSSSKNYHKIIELLSRGIEWTSLIHEDILYQRYYSQLKQLIINEQMYRQE